MLSVNTCTKTREEKRRGEMDMTGPVAWAKRQILAVKNTLHTVKTRQLWHNGHCFRLIPIPRCLWREFAILQSTKSHLSFEKCSPKVYKAQLLTSSTGLVWCKIVLNVCLMKNCSSINWGLTTGTKRWTVSNREQQKENGRSDTCISLSTMLWRRQIIPKTLNSSLISIQTARKQ